MLKKLFFCCALFIALFSFCLSISALDVSAKSAVIIESQSGDVIFSKNENIRLPMASTTKIMTAIIAIENAPMNEVVTISAEAVGVEGSSIYLKEGEKLTVKELLSALLLESANDAATALACHISGNVHDFAVLMNKKATDLGLTSTSFSNPHGLDDDSHYTTAYELAKIAQYAMKNNIFREIVASFKETIPSYDGGTRFLVNHNKLLKGYDGTIGIKTGFTKKSGRCLVSCAERNGVELIAVTLNAPNDWRDHKSMLDYGFSKYESVNLADAGDYKLALDCINGRKATALCTNFSSLSVTLKIGEKDNLRAVYEGERFIFAPIKQGEKVGEIAFYLEDDKIAALEIYALESIKSIKYKKSIIERIFG